MLYLASQSPRRRALLRRLKKPFRIVRSSYRESILRRESPSENAMRNALGKARQAVLPARASGVVIGADTFLYFRGRVLGKPKTRREAFRMIQALSGKTHRVYTGLCLQDVQTGRRRLGCAVSKVTFNRMKPEAIHAMFKRVSPLDKAGGYAIQRDHGRLIQKIEGSRTNVIGFPLELLRRELNRFGTALPKGSISI